MHNSIKVNENNPDRRISWRKILEKRGTSWEEVIEEQAWKERLLFWSQELISLSSISTIPLFSTNIFVQNI